MTSTSESTTRGAEDKEATASDSEPALSDRYEVIERLGRDAWSVRIRVLDTETGAERFVRLYVDPSVCEDDEVSEAIRSSASRRARVRHEHLVKVHDVFEVAAANQLLADVDDPNDSAEDRPEAGTACIAVVTDCMEGTSASAWLDANGPLEEDMACRVVAQVLSALSACHRKGLPHLSLRPDCVILTEREGELCALVDEVGVGCVLHRDESYLAPEQRRGAETDTRTDVYAAGLLLFELLTGERPDAGGEAGELRALLPTLSLNVERVVERALQNDPEERFPSVRVMRSALGSDAAILGSARKTQPIGQQRAAEAPLINPRRLLRTLIVLGIVAAVAGIVWALVAVLSDDEPGSDGHAPSSLGEDDEISAVAAPASMRAPLPTISEREPVPVGALPTVGSTPSLVDLIVVTSLDHVYHAPVAFEAVVAPLHDRYGDNLRTAWLLLPNRKSVAGVARTRGALAAQLQGQFARFADALAVRPELSSRAGLTALARKNGLDADQFAHDLEDPWLDELLAHHESLALQLGDDTAPGAMYVNGMRVDYAHDAPRVPSVEHLTDAIDAELDAVQAELAEGAEARDVVALRTQENLAARANRDAPLSEPTPAPYEATRYNTALDGLPSLGASNAPLTLVVYFDPADARSRAVLDHARRFYERHSDTVRLLVKLAPSPDAPRSFDIALRLLAAHADGRFWSALENEAPRSDGAAPRINDLLRSKLVEHAREVRAIAPAGAPLVLANGRRLGTTPGRLQRGLEEERHLVELVVAGGVPNDVVHSLVSAAAVPVPAHEPAAPSRFLAANWQALPRLGPANAPVVVFWRMSLHAPTWRDTLDAMLRLRDAFGDDIAIALAPAPPADLSDDATRHLFAHWWSLDSSALRTELEHLARSAGEGGVETLVATLLEGQPEPGEEVADAVASHAMQWTHDVNPDNPEARVTVAWRRGLSFVGWYLSGGKAFDAYWDVVRRALARQ